jgi:hypothetical protein
MKDGSLMENQAECLSWPYLPTNNEDASKMMAG